MRACLFSMLLCATTAATAAQPKTTDHAEAIRHLRLGQEEMHVEHWDRAEAEFKSALKLEANLEMAHYGLGQVYMATKRYPAAVASYLACRDAWTANTSASASNDLSAERQLDDQIQALEDERNLLASGRVKSMLSGGPADLDRRITDLKTRRFHGAAGVPVTPTWITVALGSAYFRSGAMADAEQQYRLALKVDAKLGEAHNNLAVICMLTGRYAEAGEEVASAERSGVRVNPQFKQDLRDAAGSGRGEGR
jgi:tetratricopeptide (TPR) repeat protein